MKSVILPSAKQIPALGQGTWQMTESGAGRREAVEAKWIRAVIFTVWACCSTNC